MSWLVAVPRRSLHRDGAASHRCPCSSMRVGPLLARVIDLLYVFWTSGLLLQDQSNTQHSKGLLLAGALVQKSRLATVVLELYYARPDSRCLPQILPQSSIFSLTSQSIPFAFPLASGGVLADATLKAQTPAGLRKVIAPKVATLSAAWSAVGSCHPCAGATLFSSIASLLGKFFGWMGCLGLIALHSVALLVNGSHYFAE